MRIWADDPLLSYSGRIDWDDKKAPVFVFPCTAVVAEFAGDYLSVHVKNRAVYQDNYLGCILDGEQYALLLPKMMESGTFHVDSGQKGKGSSDRTLYEERDAEAVLEIPVRRRELSTHSLLLFKRQDACHELIFLGLTLAEDGRLLQPPAKPKRKIEIYGDSVSAGEVSAGIYCLLYNTVGA